MSMDIRCLEYCWMLSILFYKQWCVSYPIIDAFIIIS